MRLGAQAIEVAEGTRARELYGEAVIFERHRHRYEVNNLYRDQLVDAGLVVSGTFEQGRLVEIVELPGPPVVRREPVPPGVQVAADPAGAALPRLRRCGARARARAIPSQTAARRTAVRVSEVVDLFLELAAIAEPARRGASPSPTSSCATCATSASSRTRTTRAAVGSRGQHLRPHRADGATARRSSSAPISTPCRPTASCEPVVEDGSRPQRRRDDPRRRQQGRGGGDARGSAPRPRREPAARGHRAPVHDAGGGRPCRRVRVRPHAPARTARLRLRPGRADRRDHPRRAVGTTDGRRLPRPRRALGHVPGGGPLGGPGGRESDRRPAARARRRGDDGERRRHQRWHRGEHRPRVVHVRRRGAQPRRAQARRRRSGDARRVHLRGHRIRVRGGDDAAQPVPRVPVREGRRRRPPRRAMRSSAAGEASPTRSRAARRTRTSSTSAACGASTSRTP